MRTSSTRHPKDDKAFCASTTSALGLEPLGAIMKPPMRRNGTHSSAVSDGRKRKKKRKATNPRLPWNMHHVYTHSFIFHSLVHPSTFVLTENPCASDRSSCRKSVALTMVCLPTEILLRFKAHTHTHTPADLETHLQHTAALESCSSSPTLSLYTHTCFDIILNSSPLLSPIQL